MIAENAQDLYNRVQAIPALAASTGLALGGKTPDPGLTKIPLPAAWVLADAGKTTQDIRAGRVPTLASVHLAYTVLLYVPYTSQTDLIATQLPLLETLISTVTGQTAPSGQRWFFNDFKLVLVNPDRLGYRISFLLDSIL